MNSHGHAEDGEDEVGLPFYGYESWRDEVAECEVEGPVSGGCEGVGFAAEVVGEEFAGMFVSVKLVLGKGGSYLRRIDPGNGTPCARKMSVR